MPQWVRFRMETVCGVKVGRGLTNMLEDPDWLEKLRASGKRLEHFKRCAEAEMGLPNVYLVKQAQAEFHDLCTPDRIALLIDAATAKDAAEAEAVTWRRALVLAQALTHSHETHVERGLGDRLEAALLAKDDSGTQARVGLLERVLSDICACPDIALPQILRERIYDLVDVSDSLRADIALDPDVAGNG